MRIAARVVCCVIAIWLYRAHFAALTAGQPDRDGGKTGQCGLAILQAESVAEVKGDTGRVTHVLKWRVVAVIEQPPGGKPIEVGATVERPVLRGTGRLVPPSIPKDFVTLERVYWRDGAIDSDMRTRISIPIQDPTQDPPKIVEFESKAFRADVLRLRSARTPPGQAAAFASVAATTRVPSASLIMEAHRLIERGDLSYSGRLSLCRGMLTLALRPEVPQHLRQRALGRLNSLSVYLHDDEKQWREWHVTEARELLEAFHDWVADPKRDVAYPEVLLTALQSRLETPWVRSAPALTDALARFPEDLAAYEQRLEKAGDRVRLAPVTELGASLLKTLSGKDVPNN